jgi:hypothetical protein
MGRGHLRCHWTNWTDLPPTLRPPLWLFSLARRLFLQKKSLLYLFVVLVGYLVAVVVHCDGDDAVCDVGEEFGKSGGDNLCADDDNDDAAEKAQKGT